jgi:hypothetical protein
VLTEAVGDLHDTARAPADVVAKEYETVWRNLNPRKEYTLPDLIDLGERLNPATRAGKK